jgi:hypothetical protein
VFAHKRARASGSGPAWPPGACPDWKTGDHAGSPVHEITLYVFILQASGCIPWMGSQTGDAARPAERDELCPRLYSMTPLSGVSLCGLPSALPILGCGYAALC